MRFCTVNGRFHLENNGQVLDLDTASNGALPADPIAAIERFDDVRAFAKSASWDNAITVPVESLGAPIPAPRQVFAIALNYAPHAAETGSKPPEQPLVFTKFPSCITGPVTVVDLPEGNVDWEIEVVVIIGAGGRKISRANAWDAVAAITLGQDLSERIGQVVGDRPQFSLAKSHAGFGPIGPVAVTPDEFSNRDDLPFESFLNGASLQKSSTRELIFPVDHLIEHISAHCELYPGDLIFTGTPGGVGNRLNPPRFLTPGDELISSLPGVGELRQTFTKSIATSSH